MAMAAAHFETGEDPDVTAALQWLESLAPPAIVAPEADMRTAVTCYVPVNDKAGPAKAELQSCPGLNRNKQGRTFPRVRLQNVEGTHPEMVFLVWQDALPDDDCREALQRVCSNVIRIGHSSSLVQMWLLDGDDVPDPNWFPDDLGGNGANRFRITTRGTLAYLRDAYNQDEIDAYWDLNDPHHRRKGKGQTGAKEGATGPVRRTCSYMATTVDQPLDILCEARCPGFECLLAWGCI